MKGGGRCSLRASLLASFNTSDGEAHMNKILLVGIIGRDPEARGANKDIVSTSLAVDSYGKGEKQTDWKRLSHSSSDLALRISGVQSTPASEQFTSAVTYPWWS